MDPVFALALALLGLSVGSFLNVCIARMPVGQSVVAPRSRCSRCGTPVAWFDNIPVVSFLVLGGRCRSCRASIGVRYLLVEVLTAVLFALMGFDLGLTLELLPRLAFTAILVALFFTDLETQRLPDLITLPGIALGLIASIWLPPGIQASAIGAVLGAGILWGVREIWLRARGVEAMGLGDVKMLAMVGAFLGWEQVIVVLFLSSVAGAVVGIALAVVGRGSMKTKLPFGTFIAIAALVAAVWGEALMTWYIDLNR